MRVRELRPQEAGDSKHIVGLVRENDRCLVEEFLADFAVKHKKDYATLLRRMDMIRQLGAKLRNEEILKSVTGYDGVLEIRHHNKQFRVTCFHDGKRLVCVEGFRKQATRDRQAQKYYKRAESARREYFREKEQHGEPKLDR